MTTSSKQVLDTETIEKLIAASRSAQARAYCPYSKFPVGAAILSVDGTIYQGCNIENAAYSGTICAERVAMTKAVSEGQRKFRAMAVTTDLDYFSSPCGNCRQFIVEFGKDVDIILTKKDGAHQIVPIEQLLPKSFGPEDLLTYKQKLSSN